MFVFLLLFAFNKHSIISDFNVIHIFYVRSAAELAIDRIFTFKEYKEEMKIATLTTPTLPSQVSDTIRYKFYSLNTMLIPGIGRFVIQVNIVII